MKKINDFIPGLVIIFGLMLCPPSLSFAADIAISIPLTVQETAGIARINEPVTSGIPIPQAANLLSAATLGIFDGTTEIPAQFQVLARWGGSPDNPSKPIKWILIDFQATVAANTSKTYTLKDTGNGTASTGITVNDGVSSS